MKLAIMQPYFMPYLGYFQLMNAVDKFVIYDDIQFTKKGWINRNRICLNGKSNIFSIPLKKDSDYFGNTSQQYMINYRVENLPLLVEQLKKEGVTIVDEIEAFEYGKFVHILDLEGNRVELWEANDEVYEKMLNAVTK